MQLIITTDYAIRLVYYLSAEKETKNTTVIENALGIPASYVQKVVKPLKEAGIRWGGIGKFVLPYATAQDISVSCAVCVVYGIRPIKL